tara:strand:+ start:2357 stop:3190 length:834 start_codon:yes stop_codon:yes gene_type:complete
MKTKHNKKRNTAFIYESLIREATAAMIKNDNVRKNKAVNLIRKHFHDDSVLLQHLKCYQSLYENQDINKETAEKILKEAKIASRVLDAHGLFVKQSDLIKDVNKDLSPEFFNTFVPNYKTLASIYQIFSNKSSPRQIVMLEKKIVDDMIMAKEPVALLEDIDNVVYSTFVEKFNQKYDSTLLQEQKQLLGCYISSFIDNGLDLKTYLNSEIRRLKESLADSLSSDEIKQDENMVRKTNKIIEKLENYKSQQIDEQSLLTILKIQQLVKEISDDADKG